MRLYRGLSRNRNVSTDDVLYHDFSENATGWVSGPLPDFAVLLPSMMSRHESFWLKRPPVTARTPMGSRLRRLRAVIVASGESLLDLEGVRREVADRRGERE